MTYPGKITTSTPLTALRHRDPRPPPLPPPPRGRPVLVLHDLLLDPVLMVTRGPHRVELLSSGLVVVRDLQLDLHRVFTGLCDKIRTKSVVQCL